MAGLLQPEQQKAPQPAPQAPVPAKGQEADADESNPAFQQAMYLAKQSLYEAGAADNISQQIKKAKDKVDTVANIAYEMTAIVDERTNGEVPDELLVLLAASLLEEVADIASASGVELKPSDLATAMKTMILRFVGEQGHDVRQLKAAMDQVKPEEFDKMVDEQPDEPQTEPVEEPVEEQV